MAWSTSRKPGDNTAHVTQQLQKPIYMSSVPGHVRLFPPARLAIVKNGHTPSVYWASLVAQSVQTLSAMQKTWFQSLDQEDPLEKEMATHSSILAWRIPMDRGAWRGTVPGVTKSRTLLSDYTDTTKCLSTDGMNKQCFFHITKFRSKSDELELHK